MATEATITTETTDIDRMMESTFVLNLTIGSIRTRAKVKRERVEKMAGALRTEQEPETVSDMTRDDADEIHVSKELLRVDEVAALISELGSTRALLRENAQPTSKAKRIEKGRRAVRLLRGGLYLYAATRVEWAESQLTSAQARIDGLLDALEPRWEAIINEDRERLEPLGLFDPRDYPTLASIREATTLRYSWLRFDIPIALRTISPALFEAEREKAKGAWRDMFDQIRLNYAATLQDFVEKLKASLTPGEDGKVRVLRQSSIDRGMEFLSGYRLQDVTGFEELAVLVDRAKDALRGIDADVLRSEERAASRVASAMNEIGGVVSSLVIEQTRRVQLRD